MNLSQGTSFCNDYMALNVRGNNGVFTLMEKEREQITVSSASPYQVSPWSLIGALEAFSYFPW